MHQVPVKIGRQVPDALDSPYHLESTSTEEASAPKSFFSESSTSRRMCENLNNGKEYLNLQGLGLLEIQNTLALLAKNNHQRLFLSHSPPVSHSDSNRIFIQTIEFASKRTYSNFRLFGDGSESPLRIHLRHRGREFTHTIPIVPLLRDPSFLGIVYSGRANTSPSQELVNDCIRAILQFSLQVESEKVAIDNIREAFSANHAFKAYLNPPKPTGKNATKLPRKRHWPGAIDLIRSWLRSLRPIGPHDGVLIPES